MGIARYLSKLAGVLSADGVVPPSKGGTGITSPGASGNVLVSDGTSWTSQAGGAGPTGPVGPTGAQGIVGPTGPAGTGGSGGGSSAYSNQYVVTGTTNNSTETEIFVNGTAESRIAVPNNTTVHYTAEFVCTRTDAPGDYAAFYLKGLATNASNTTSDIGLIYEVIVARTDASINVDIRANNTNDSIEVYATGATGKTLSWKCVITTVEV